MRECLLCLFKLSPNTSISLTHVSLCTQTPTTQHADKHTLITVYRFTYRHIHRVSARTFFSQLSRSDIKHHSPLNLPSRHTCTHTHTLTKSVTRRCESPASVKSCKHMRTVRNSFPILWSIWKSPSTPPFPSALAFALCPHCQWHHLKFSTLHHLLLFLLRLPPARPFYPFMSPDFIRLPLSKTFLPCPLHRPPLSLTSTPPPPLPSPLPCIHSSVGMSSVFPAFEGFSSC